MPFIKRLQGSRFAEPESDNRNAKDIRKSDWQKKWCKRTDMLSMPHAI